MKICSKCKKELNFERYGKNKRRPDGYRSECKECRNSPLRTGRQNTGRFQKGHQPTNGFQIGKPSPRKGIFKSLERRESKARQWSRLVRERDNWTCQHCGYYGFQETKKLDAHHLIAWEDNKEKRFELSNGQTLCKKCHAKETMKEKNGFGKGGNNGCFKKGHKHSEETLKKISESKKII